LSSSLAVTGNTNLNTLTSAATTLTGGLTISGVALDITTNLNETLSLIPNGTGNVGIGTSNAGGILVIMGQSGTGTGNVGIGFTTPTASLHILNTASQNSFRIDDILEDTTPLIVDSAGNLGIGATTAVYNLDVWGTGRVTGALTVGGNLGIGNSLTVDNLSLSRGGLRVNGFSDLTGNVGIGGSLTVSSTGAFRLLGQDCSTLTNNGKLTTDAGGNVYCAADSGGSLSGGVQNLAAIWQSSSTLGVGIIYDSGANVGIGTSSPLSRFDIRGAGNSTNLAFLTYGTGATNQFGLSVTDVGNVGIGVTNPSSSLSIFGNVGIGWTGAPTAAMPGLGLSVFGNVGIGTTTPTFPLHVIGNVGIGTSLTVTNIITTSGLNVTGASSLGVVNSGAITSSGNVGVGLSLNVNGTDSLVNASNLNVSGTSVLGNAFTGALTVGGVALIGDGGDSITLSGTTITLTANSAGNDISLNLVDNNTDALDIQQGSDNYLNINTTNSAENISFGNSTTNPQA
ncbi:hypothetical protein HYS94_01265, partial [Candidatus Daviesbacteria bacterium]|nr:hypothetical protein [Candidatus Daviesbacteria bacterium]